MSDMKSGKTVENAKAYREICMCQNIKFTFLRIFVIYETNLGNGRTGPPRDGENICESIWFNPFVIDLFIKYSKAC